MSLIVLILDVDDVVDADAQGADFVPQAAAGDAQNAGGLGLVSAGLVEHPREQIALDEFHRFGVQVFGGAVGIA